MQFLSSLALVAIPPVMDMTYFQLKVRDILDLQQWLNPRGVDV